MAVAELPDIQALSGLPCTPKSAGAAPLHAPQAASSSAWPTLPSELLRLVFHAASRPAAGAATLSLVEAARLLHAFNACRAWRELAAAEPLRVAIGRSMLPPEATPRLLDFLCRHRLEALTFEVAPQTSAGSHAVQHLAIELLGSPELATSAGERGRQARWAPLPIRSTPADPPPHTPHTPRRPHAG